MNSSVASMVEGDGGGLKNPSIIRSVSGTYSSSTIGLTGEDS